MTCSPHFLTVAAASNTPGVAARCVRWRRVHAATQHRRSTAVTKTISEFVQSCLADAGNHESPLGSNHTKYGVEFGWDRVSWCCIYGWCKYRAAGVVLPLKSASCVMLYDDAVKNGYHYTSDHCVLGDAVIRTWQRLDRHAPAFDPEETHFQIVVKIQHRTDGKWLGLWGGNQGAGYVGPDIEWVHAGDSSILGALAYHRLFAKKAKPGKPLDKRRDIPHLPKAKSHPHPLTAHKQSDAADLTDELAGRHKPLPTGKGSGRGKLRALAAQIRRLLHGGTK